MAEECADALIKFGADDVFEFAGVQIRLTVHDRERVHKEPLGQSAAANDIPGTVLAGGSKRDSIFMQFDQLKIL